MVVIIAEKPSVGKDLARIVGATTRRDGYMEGNGYAVTWAFGHLVQIVTPASDVAWSAEYLPILPEGFLLSPGTKRGPDGKPVVDEGYVKQLNTIKSLFDNADYIINAGDAGREGELIQRYIYSYVGCTKPVKRLWISSLTDNAIRDGLANLHDASEFDPLYAAGKARSESDWLVGINATRALSIAAKYYRKGSNVLSLGRVQTPTLAMVCKRYLENQNFVPQPFWNIKVTSQKGGIVFTAITKDRFTDSAKSASALAAIQALGTMTVTKAETKEKSQQPPYLHDLTSLQKEANRKYNMSAQDVLDTAQSLYEKKVLTYPRTGSKFIPEDVFATVPSLLRNIYDNTQFGSYAMSLEGKTLNKHSVDATKVTDHHALLPTEVKPSGDLTDSERKIYNLVIARLLEAVSPKCDYLSTVVEFDSASNILVAKGNVIVNPGWKAVLNEKEAKKGDEPEQTLPSFTVGDVLPVDSAECVEGKTKPKPIHTEASLLEAMEHAGKEIEDDELRESLKDIGIGTPATRAGEIETLLRRNYITRKGKSLIPTEMGLTIYDIVKDMYIANVEMTGKWEIVLSKIVDGEASARAFDESIRRYVVALTKEILETGIEDITCPKCNTVMKIWDNNVKCPECGLNVWRTVAKKKLSLKEMCQLIMECKTDVLDGFVSKAGKPFKASLILLEDGSVSFDFSAVNAPSAASAAAAATSAKAPSQPSEQTPLSEL